MIKQTFLQIVGFLGFALIVVVILTLHLCFNR